MTMLLSYCSLRFSRLSIAGTIAFWCIVLLVYIHPIRLFTLEDTKSSGVLSGPRIPERIWYKIGPKGHDLQSREWMDDCLRKNPTHRAEILTDQLGERFVNESFASRPDIIETYFSLPLPIHKADFLRYLILYAEGGIWSDLDVSCEDVPISNWLPAEFQERANVVVGLEFDVGWGDHIFRQFATWTIMAAPKSPHMLRVIDDIVDAMREVTQSGQLPTNMIDTVVDFTGPRRFTRGILESLGSAVNGTISPDSFTHLLEPKMIEDVVIMPGYSFSASVNKYDPSDVVGPPLVKHHYAGSWKNANGGEA
ncbi:hypothetical protein BDV25DRAFT_146602 [Aspergillus avenaceus]|uniref:Nucleotide-diphospho-sugar transferase n=1 Tax=Aspergillus avenaceus TaxID=36643 RepID=A0A5N6U966_ASPAV|nr:hypothetical protein BDV25DRAFT_146602 [Aspergillus avenaceus]